MINPVSRGGNLCKWDKWPPNKLGVLLWQQMLFLIRRVNIQHNTVTSTATLDEESAVQLAVAPLYVSWYFESVSFDIRLFAAIKGPELNAHVGIHTCAFRAL